MALNIRNGEVEDFARELARLTGETKTEAVKKALYARLQLVKQEKKMTGGLCDDLNEIAIHCASLPVLYAGTTEDFLYDEKGMPL
ncbi:MAG: type II toxin-antitoxin system VapB family antitoxin [Nitrospirae bacterium]|nr:type II toxin-antitoxin system VapB family antitoxin [Candidatus Manganitrophaceae bacterium]